MLVLVTRPQPEAARTAARLTALGHRVVLAPLLTTAAVAWHLPAAMPDALAFTSAAAVRLAGPQLDGLRHLPVFAVGAATAAAARDAGFEDVQQEGPRFNDEEQQRGLRLNNSVIPAYAGMTGRVRPIRRPAPPRRFSSASAPAASRASSISPGVTGPSASCRRGSTCASSMQRRWRRHCPRRRARRWAGRLPH